MENRWGDWGGEEKNPREWQNLFSITTRDFVILRYFSIHFPITRDKKIFRYFPDASQISATVGDRSRQMKTQMCIVGDIRRWISLISSAPDCWAPVPLSHKFQFFAHYPFPAKFIGRIRDKIVAIIRYILWRSAKSKIPDRLGISRHIKSFINLGKPFFRISRIWNIAQAYGGP